MPMFRMLMMLQDLLGGAGRSLTTVYVNEVFPSEIRVSGFGWDSGLGRIVLVDAPVATQLLASAVGVAHAIAVSAFIWIRFLIGFLILHETVGAEIDDRVVLVPAFEGAWE
jgi:hypothetical protein